MPCNPNDTTINVPAAPGVPINGFGIPFSPPQLPLKGIELPNIESVLDLVNEFTARFPSSDFKPNLDDGTNTVLTALMSLLDQVAPFLSLYKFFQPAINMLLCLLEILCAFPNPFKMFRAMRRLFKRCLPDLMKLFPFLALLVMILSLLLIILALIEYIIAMVEKLIEDLLANIITLEKGLSLQDDDAVSATARKIAQLLCLMENLFSVLIAISSIISIIQALAGISGKSACGGGGAPSAGDESCCSSDVCPPFVTDNPDGIVGISGELIYYNRINTDLRGIFGALTAEQAGAFNLPALRNESWQFINQATNQPYPFKDIITAINGGDIFFPEGVTFNKNTRPNKAPYTLDLTLTDFDPKVFLNYELSAGRDFLIKDLIITEKPYIGVLDFDNNLNYSLNSNGTFNLAGGLVYEIDQVTKAVNPYYVNGAHATIESFIHHNPKFGYLPAIDDGYMIGDVKFTLNINHETLIHYGLITLGCHPDIAQERFVANTSIESIGFDAISVKLPDVGANGILPDALGAQKCTAAAIEKLRASVSPENVAIFQAEIDACLSQLRSEVLQSYCNILRAGVSAYESTIKINNDIEFITRPIKVDVQLLDPNGTLISFNIPPSCIPEMEEALQGNVTLGKISDFKYDGTSTFKAEITSKEAGNGELTVTFDGNTFKKIIGTDETPSIIKDNILAYQFISTSIISKVPGSSTYEEQVRRDDSDIAGDNP